ncbi:MAG: alpha/beta fold hydrolase [Bacteroidia bacterium]
MNIRLLLRLIGFGLNTLSWLMPKKASELALFLFVKPPKPRIRPKEQAFLAKASQSLMDNVVLYEWGETDRPYVLLAYGWAYNAGRWRHFVPAMLDAGYRVIAFDPPGHGHAPSGTVSLPVNARLMQKIIELYGRPEVIIGHSFGGASAMLALSHLEKSLHPARLVLMAAFSEAEGVFREYQRNLGMREGLYQDFVRYTESVVGGEIASYDLARIAGDMEHVSGLVIHDPNDDMTPFYHAERYQQLWPGSRLWATTAGGHHLGTAEITKGISLFATEARFPAQAERSPRPFSAKHDLTRFWASLQEY